MLNSYTAASLGVPAVFLSGDEAICESSLEMVPRHYSRKDEAGDRGATYCVSPEKVVEELKERRKNP